MRIIFAIRVQFISAYKLYMFYIGYIILSYNNIIFSIFLIKCNGDAFIIYHNITIFLGSFDWFALLITNFYYFDIQIFK